MACRFDSERSSEFTFQVIVQALQPAQDVYLFGAVVRIVADKHDFNEQGSDHVDVNLSTILGAGTKGNALFLEPLYFFL